MSGIGEVLVSASLAHKCLQSVSLIVAKALELVESIEPYLEWESNAIGGAAVGLYYDLFPHIEDKGYFRWKENAAFVILTNQDSSVPNSTTDYNFRTDINITGQPFLSYDDKFAPHYHKGVPYTNLLKSDERGYPKNVTNPFSAEDIIILTDGYCSSACALVADMLNQQAHVKTVVGGGRPNNGAMQAVGGTRGGGILPVSMIHYQTKYALSQTKDPKEQAVLSKYNLLPAQRGSLLSVNNKDVIFPENVEDCTPAQFFVKNSDCRLYWTEGMMRNITAVWDAAANAGFKGAKCAWGGIQHGGERGSGSLSADESRERVAGVNIALKKYRAEESLNEIPELL